MVSRCWPRGQHTTFAPGRTATLAGLGARWLGARWLGARRLAGLGLAGLATGCVHVPSSDARGPAAQASASASGSASLGAPAQSVLNPADSAGFIRGAEGASTAIQGAGQSAGTQSSSGSPTAEGAFETAPSATMPDRDALVRAAIGEERYLDAWQLLEGGALADSPAHSLVVGVVASNLGLFDRAASALQNAEQEYPALAPMLAPLLRRARVESHEYQDALPELQKSKDLGELVTVASRLLADGKLDDAFAFIQRAANVAGSSKSRQARVRALRARIYLARGLPFGALIDYRWLAFYAPLEPDAADADTQLALHFPNNPLNLEQRLARATLFSDGGRIEDLERELAAARLLPNFKLKPAEELHLRAMARYQARDFGAAAELLQQAADGKCNEAIGDMYRAGQSLSRVGRAREAIAQFERVAQSRPVGSLTVAAKFRIGSEWLALGDWQHALDAHAEFLERNPGSEFTETAERERAVAWFAVGEPLRAAFAFRKLRATHAGSGDADLYQLLEAVSLQQAGKTDAATPLLQGLGNASPLSFSGQMARARLNALGAELPPLLPGAGLPKPELRNLPGIVTGLERAGLRSWSEDALRLLEPSWLDGVSENRGYLQCQGYGELQTARRRFVIGSELGNKLSFWSRPSAQEPWLWQCLYPNPFGEIVRQFAATWHVSPALVYAVMRQESGFHPTIRSPAQAAGLMQIIEPTALRIAAELGEPAQVDKLQTPRDNIRFGVFYLHKLLDLFERHPAPAVAAYNAGPAAALRWQNAAKDLPVEVFIARIPYEETRTYVQRVLGNLQVYETLYPEFERLDVPFAMSISAENPASSANLPIDGNLY